MLKRLCVRVIWGLIFYMWGITIYVYYYIPSQLIHALWDALGQSMNILNLSNNLPNLADLFACLTTIGKNKLVLYFHKELFVKRFVYQHDPLY